MRKDLYQELYDLEDNYWWQVGKREIVSHQLSARLAARQVFSHQKREQRVKVLDVGCGTGRWMEEAGKITGGEVWGIDNQPQAVEFCQKRGLKNLKLGLAEKLPFPDSSFNLVTCLDLLEHTKNDQKVISEIYRVLIPGGILILSVPAYQKLFSYWDKMLRHQRRYENKEIRNMLAKQKFKIIKLTYSNFFVFLPSVLIRFAKSKRKNSRETSDFMPVPFFLNIFLKILYNLEALLLTEVDFPFGLSILAVVQK